MLKNKEWDPFFYQHFSGYESVAVLWQPLAHQFINHWPKVSDYNFLAEKQGSPLRFGAQTTQSFYEWEIYKNKTVPTRDTSWHDFFNNLTWLCWPKLKWALISRLCQDSQINQNHSRNRTPLQNLLTQFDEYGAVICCDSKDIIETIKNFSWKKLFLETKDLLEHCQCVLIGHGLFEKLLTPFIGMTTKAIFLEVPSFYFKLPLSEQMAVIDKEIATYFLSPVLPHSPKALQPFPFLGWPNWYQENRNKSFYDNESYFRTARSCIHTQELAYWLSENL